MIPFTSPLAQLFHVNLKLNTLCSVGIKEKSSPVSDMAKEWKTFYLLNKISKIGAEQVVGASITPEHLLVTN